MKAAAKGVEKPVLGFKKAGHAAVELGQVVKVGNNIQIKPGGPETKILIGFSTHPVTILIGVGIPAIGKIIVIARIIGIAQVVIEKIGHEKTHGLTVSGITEFRSAHKTAFGEIFRIQGNVAAWGKVDEKRGGQVKAVPVGGGKRREQKTGLPIPFGRQHHDRSIEHRYTFYAKGRML